MAAGWQERAYREGLTSAEYWHLQTAHLNINSMLICSSFIGHKRYTESRIWIYKSRGGSHIQDTFKIKKTLWVSLHAVKR